MEIEDKLERFSIKSGKTDFEHPLDTHVDGILKSIFNNSVKLFVFYLFFKIENIHQNNFFFTYCSDLYKVSQKNVPVIFGKYRYLPVNICKFKGLSTKITYALLKKSRKKKKKISYAFFQVLYPSCKLTDKSHTAKQ